MTSKQPSAETGEARGEPVYQVQNADKTWRDISKETYERYSAINSDIEKKHGYVARGAVRILHTRERADSAQAEPVGHILPDQIWHLERLRNAGSKDFIEVYASGMPGTVPLYRAAPNDQAEIARLREYYEATEDILKTGTLDATTEQLDRRDLARAALASAPTQGEAE